MPAPFSISLKTSLWQIRFWMAGYLVAFIFVAVAELSIALVLILLCFLCAAAFFSKPVSTPKIGQLSWRDKQWFMSTGETPFAVELLSWRKLGAVTLMDFTPVDELTHVRPASSNRRIRLVLFPDSANPDELKAIRRALKSRL